MHIVFQGVSGVAFVYHGVHLLFTHQSRFPAHHRAVVPIYFRPFITVRASSSTEFLPTQLVLSIMVLIFLVFWFVAPVFSSGYSSLTDSLVARFSGNLARLGESPA